MNKSFKFILSIVIIILFSGFKTNITSVHTITEAVSKGLVNLNIKSNGGHTGECLNVNIRNSSNEVIQVRFPAGTLFEAEDSTLQDIVQVKELLVSLGKSQTRSFNLTGFCSQAAHRSPVKESKYKIGGPASNSLHELAEFLNQNSFETEAMQSAVWTITNGNNIAEIYDEDPDKMIKLRTKVSGLSGQNNVWYATRVNSQIDESGFIVREPVQVSGDMVISLDWPAKLSQEVCKENGEVVWKMDKTVDLPKSNAIKLKFNLKVSGWQPGKYYVKASIPGKIVFKQEFTI